MLAIDDHARTFRATPRLTTNAIAFSSHRTSIPSCAAGQLLDNVALLLERPDSVKSRSYRKSVCCRYDRMFS